MAQPASAATRKIFFGDHHIDFNLIISLSGQDGRAAGRFAGKQLLTRWQELLLYLDFSDQLQGL
jgi:hypothetical protein